MGLQAWGIPPACSVIEGGPSESGLRQEQPTISKARHGRALVVLMRDLRQQLLLACCDSFADAFQIKLGTRDLGEEFGLFFLYVVGDVFTQHLHLGVIEIVGWLHGLDLSKQVFYRRMFECC